MRTLFQDLRYGFRRPAKNPGLAAIAALAIVHCIGANTAASSILNSNQQTAGTVTLNR